MKILILLSLFTYTLTCQASEELSSFVANTGKPFKTQAQHGSCWCPPVPCWGESCQSTYPENYLTKYNRKQEKNFRILFPEGGPWDMPGNSIKKCLVNYMRNTTPYNCTTATAVPATALATTLVGASVGTISMCIGQWCCGCPDGHNTCSHFLTEICCPFACDASKALCCPPNGYNVLTMIAELGCMALPFACFGLESCCVYDLSDPKNWTDSAETSYQSISQPDKN